MKFKINNKSFDTDKGNEDLLRYLCRTKMVRFKNIAEKEIIRQLLGGAGYFEKNVKEVIILCKKCKHRLKSFTDGSKLHCDCDTVYYKSDGTMLSIEAPNGSFEILLTNPEHYA